MQSDVILDAALCAYDAGLLNDYGGGDVGWWQDYLRAELGRAHDHYEAQFADRLESLSRQLADAQRERDDLRAAVKVVRAEITQRKTRYASSDVAAIAANWSRGFADATQGALEILAYYVPAEHTEGGKP